jgi:hypothetical protein
MNTVGTFAMERYLPLINPAFQRGDLAAVLMDSEAVVNRTIPDHSGPFRTIPKIKFSGSECCRI